MGIAVLRFLVHDDAVGIALAQLVDVHGTRQGMQCRLVIRQKRVVESVEPLHEPVLHQLFHIFP